jgi:hypothetical protein
MPRHKESDEQRLINLMFQVGFLTRENAHLKQLSRDDYAAWIREQLDEWGFKTVPVGMSWGTLIKD